MNECLTKHPSTKINRLLGYTTFITTFIFKFFYSHMYETCCISLKALSPLIGYIIIYTKKIGFFCFMYSVYTTLTCLCFEQKAIGQGNHISDVRLVVTIIWWVNTAGAITLHINKGDEKIGCYNETGITRLVIMFHVGWTPLKLKFF